jgi:ribosome-associated protein
MSKPKINDEYSEEYGDRPSKSRLKRECDALEDLGEELVALQESQLVKLDLSERLQDAVREARLINSHGAMKRQRKFIGKLLREMDTTQLRKQMDEFEHSILDEKRELKQIETWRDRLLQGSDGDLGELLSQHPEADRTQLRHWIRDARRESESSEPPRAARLLFRYLRDLLYPK